MTPLLAIGDSAWILLFFVVGMALIIFAANYSSRRPRPPKKKSDTSDAGV